jgi:membrane dipeptidase
MQVFEKPNQSKGLDYTASVGMRQLKRRSPAWLVRKAQSKYLNQCRFRVIIGVCTLDIGRKRMNRDASSSWAVWDRGRVEMCRVGYSTVAMSIALVIAPICFGDDSNADNKGGEERIVVSEEAMAIHRRGYVFDGHNDLPWEVRKFSKRFEQIDLRQDQPKLHTDIKRLAKGNVGAQFWSVYVPSETMRAGNAFQTTVEQIELVHDMIARYPDVFHLALNSDDIEEARRLGKIASLIGMEGGHSIEESIPKLRKLYEMGARYMTLTHSDTLSWADSATDSPKNDGLSSYGEEIVREMNRLGMLVDISHVSPATMHAALNVSKAPIIFSHSSARAIADHPRNVPDDVLKRLPENGGVVMVNFFSGFVVPESARIMLKMFEVRRQLLDKYPNSKEDVDREYRAWQLKNPYPAGDASIVVDHIEHIIKVAGVDHVGLGSDYDGIDKAPVGMEDVSTYPIITELLLRRGYSEEDIHKVLYKNTLRVIRAAEQVRDELTNNS